MRIRGLELLFNIEKKNLKSKEDCLVAAIHCLLINENLQCVGIDDEWPETDSISTELLPGNWNINQDVYSLRYSSKDRKRRILVKATRMDHILQMDFVMNEDIVASLPITVDKYISDDYSEYSSAYKDLESLSESFRKDIIEKLEPTEKKVPSKPLSAQKTPTTPTSPLSGLPPSSKNPRDPLQRSKPPQSPPFPRTDDDDLFNPLRDHSQRSRYPRIGGNDLDPFSGPGAGGMFMDPSSLGIPSRPTLPQFGVGGPGGLPRGAVPPGARFDPFMPPIRRPRNPDSDHYPPPDFDDLDFM